ncbi:DUF6436 domain-containing protein [Reinekea marinisedimentorum]|uniref:DUF6436 domain-containing protein n=1 Tax=Reinekea marinisedimentorum TaxID=230495 RepID=A0A4R3I9F2_9GAMM|nr:DUF6436 domain-containing protein [Reinekea marinisedimentorum]TCS43018.1 hypothetical protein BCF53_10241 [Reinekea marinisedimentorum]
MAAASSYRIGLLLAALFIALSAGASYWFTQNHVDWLIKEVPDSILYQKQWQTQIDQMTSITHPAVFHWLPTNCFCRYFSLNHAKQISDTAKSNGYSVFQLNTKTNGLGKTVTLPDSFTTPLSPIIVITRPDGSIVYVGAYSDGVQCNTGTSMVYRFLEDPKSLPARTLVGLNVKTCRCVD